MRTSLILTTAILLLAAALGWEQERRIRVERATNLLLGTEATALGISAEHSGKRPTTKLRDRGDTSNGIRGLATGLLEAVKLGPKERWQNGRMELLEKLEDLDRGEFEELLALMRSNLDSQSGAVKELIALHVLYHYVNRHPQAGLDYLVNHRDVLEEGSEEKRNLLYTALARWRENPEAVLKWYLANRDRLPELQSEGIRSMVVINFAYQNPRAAFAVIKEIGLGPDVAVSVFFSAGLEHRTEALNQFRKYAEGVEDQNALDEIWHQGLRSAGAGISSHDFERDVQRLSSGGLSSEELKIVAANLKLSELKPADAGKWISWISETAGDQSAAPIRSVVSQWVTQDYAAATEWLDAMRPDDPVRNASIAAYAETVARYHPETATHWAEQLPPGEARDGTLKAIYENWPDEDPASKAAAEAFKTAHGLE